MYGAKTLDHIAFPVRDLDRSEKFYLETVGLKFMTRRKNADGSARHTYVLAGENIVGLTLPGVQVARSESGAPRYGIALESGDSFAAAAKRIKESGMPCGSVVEHDADSPWIKSLCFVDPDDNHMEICLRQSGPSAPCVSHVIFETKDLAKTSRFWTEALGLSPIGDERGEKIFQFENGQILGLKEVSELSERTKKKGRACHVAFNVTQEDYDRMVALITDLGGRSLGDHRSTDGLRPPGERSIYFFDPDNNYLQITAHGEKNWDLMSDEEKWRRIQENRAKQGKGISSFDAGKKASA
ncbi:MAG TPA: VOC family protein [Candidatus Binatia bacterium]|jgi:catechol 2,3-dioxygenase-like lactoylglutathione lyase family enzyme